MKRFHAVGGMMFMAMPRRSPHYLLKAVRPSSYLRFLIFWLPFSLGMLLTACSDEEQSGRSQAKKPESQMEAARWYTAENVTRGDPIFVQYCASCHGKGGQGSFTWRQPQADGSYPPPPLNGTGHAWHHPISALGSQIKFGAPGGGGKMPAFSQTLSDQDVIDVIAWFQDKWSDEIYSAWLTRELQSRSGTQ
jgi:mono/diheme cytochrome c family protein